MKNKILILLTAGVMVFSLSACTDKNQAKNPTEETDTITSADPKTEDKNEEHEVDENKNEDNEVEDKNENNDTEGQDEIIQTENDFREKYAKELEEIQYIYTLGDEVDSTSKWPTYKYDLPEREKDLYVVLAEAGNVKLTEKLDQQLKAYAEENNKNYINSDIYYKDGAFIYGIRYQGEVGDFDDFKISEDFVYNCEDVYYLDDGPEDRETLLNEISWAAKNNAPGSDDFTVMSFIVKDKAFGDRVIERIQETLQDKDLEMKFLTADPTKQEGYYFDFLVDGDVYSNIIGEIIEN